MMTDSAITIQATITAPLSKVWEIYTNPEHIIHWNSASPDRHTPKATNDLRVGGRFTFRMEAKDGSMGFDFGGTYDNVVPLELIAYTMDDQRKAKVNFQEKAATVEVIIQFDAEATHTEEQQREGWQAILDNFKAYVESQK